MSRNHIRRMTPDQLHRHQAGVRRLDEAFGTTGTMPTSRGDRTAAHRRLLEALGFGPRPRSH